MAYLNACKYFNINACYIPGVHTIALTYCTEIAQWMYVVTVAL